VLKKPLGPLSSKQSLVQGANGSSYRSWTTSRTMDLGKGEIKHSFLVIPNCPSPLMGRDLLTKLRAQITFEETGPEIAFLNPSVQPLTTSVLTIRAEDEYRLFTNDPLPVESQDTDFWLRLVPEAWAETAGLGLSTLQAPVVVELKTTAVPVRVRQYPMSQEAKKGITPHIRKLLQQGVLVKCQSAWNTPLLPVKKPGTGDYRPVQDLRAVNSQVEVIHPTVPNPYNLLSTLSPERVWYSVLDLKDAFFCLSLHPASQPLFAFEWSDPEAGISGQLTWTRLPQGFKNSPTIFDEALHQDLSLFRSQHPQVTLLQYVDDILLAGKTEEDCKQATHNLLKELARLGYRASAKKAQLCQREVTFLGYMLRGGKRWLTEARKKVVAQIPAPTTRRQLQLAIVHCPGHQTGKETVASGNRRADEAAKAAASRMKEIPALIVTEPDNLPPVSTTVDPLSEEPESDRYSSLPPSVQVGASAEEPGCQEIHSCSYITLVISGGSFWTFAHSTLLWQEKGYKTLGPVSRCHLGENLSGLQVPSDWIIMNNE
ncbi:uncharacterized protein LOC126004334, partial [Suncus etruscus]|uniref:uncharacterized protein LOC126004334 n=1 Tax=Suncus etruscus TaxID=109475 RepID=UPI0021106509